MRGDIQGISLSPVGFTDGQIASRYRFTVIVKIKFEDVAAQKTLWENPSLSFSDEYDLASPGIGAARRRRRSSGRSARPSIACPPTLRSRS